MNIEARLAGKVVWTDTFIPSGADEALVIKASKYEALTQGKLTADQINEATWFINKTPVNPTVPNDRTPWTAEDIALLQKMRRDSVSSIAKALGRTEAAVRTRASQGGIQLG